VRSVAQTPRRTETGRARAADLRGSARPVLPDADDVTRGVARLNPKAIGGATGRTLLVVDDPDAVFRHAVAAGAAASAEPADEHGWRLARITDPFGHQWEIGRPLGTWPPAISPISDTSGK
jgi:hypothetical protein